MMLFGSMWIKEIEMKYIKIVLVLVMSLVLITGCGLDEDEDENIVNTPTEEPPKEVPPTKEPSSPAEPTNVEPTKTPSITQKAHYGNWIYLDDSSSAKIDGDFNYSIKTL